MEKKRYVVTLDLYVYAEDDKKAKEEAWFYKQHNRLVEDNNTEIVSIHEAPFGVVGELREVEK